MQVDDHTFVNGNQIDHLAHREVLSVPERQHRTRDDLGLVPRGVEPRPDEAGLVLVGEVDFEVLLVVAQVDDVVGPAR